MKPFTLYLCICFSTMVMGQKQDYIWHLGKDQDGREGLQTMEVNFNRGPFDIEIQETPVGFDHNNRAICDEEGNLLFYTNGCAIVNREHQIMPNGHRMNWDSVFTAWTGWNEDCALGYPGVQNILILDDPAYSDGYYVIHKGQYFTSDGNTHPDFRYSYVNLSLENGLGDVVIVDSVLSGINPLGANLTAIRHTNQRDWWILQPLEASSSIATFKIDGNGLNRLEDQESFEYFDYWFSGGSGTARFSPDGTKYALFSRVDDLHLYDFNRGTGLLSNHQKIDLFGSPKDSSDHKAGSVEWSPSGRFAYVCAHDSLFQIDTWEEDIQNDGISLIDVYNGTLDPFPTNFYLMTLAPDSRIYMCFGNGSDSYSVINNPNELGTACDFVQNGIKLPQHAGSANLPLHPRWRVDEEDVCDSSITSIFGNDIYIRKELHFFPNPTQDYINVQLPEEIVHFRVEIYNSAGVRMYELRKERTSDILKIDLEFLPEGMYELELHPSISNARKFYSSKIAKIR